MSLQNKPIVIGTPVEVEAAVNNIRVAMSALPWITNPYFVAEKFVEIENGNRFIYPETYCRVVGDGSLKYDYARLTPDNDYEGMFFFLVSDASYESPFNSNDVNYLSYNVGMIFSVNLKTINTTKLDDGLFTQELIKEARQLLKKSIPSFSGFQASIIAESRDLTQVYREFDLGDIKGYNRAPQQCFRFDLTLIVSEECP